MKTKGGKNLYGASIGIMMLETRFPRIPGDIGNANTWPFAVHYEPVSGAYPDNVVREQGGGKFDEFIRAGKALIKRGADALSTNCGFLILFQDELTKELGVPILTSSLMQYGLINQTLPHDKVPGIITISKNSLKKEHLNAAKIPLDVAIVGMEDMKTQEFHDGILDDEETMDFDLCKDEMVEAALTLQKNNPNVGAILCECTNMVPYARDMYKATGLPVYSIYSALLWFQQSVSPRIFDIKEF